MKQAVEFKYKKSWGEAEKALIDASFAALSVSDIPSATQIAAILNQMDVDHEIIAAAVLYADGKNEPNLSNISKNIVELFHEAQSLIREEDGWVAKIAAQPDSNRPDTNAHHMMLLSMMKDVRVVFILLAHQVWIMRNLKQYPEDHQKAEAWETRAIFAPLANRLGIGQLKWELEDLAFRYLEPAQYKAIAKDLEERRVDREEYITQVVALLQEVMAEAGIKAEVYGRPKHIFSIWKKMQKKHLDFSELYDVRAIRIMVEDLNSCYAALSAVHSRWPFIPGEYDDYIAAPKSNNYQSLHTAIIGPDEKVVEIQIRTHEMHDHAELGVAAHWRYKEGGRRDHGLESRIESLRGLLQDDKPADIPGVDVPEEDIYVLTPKGSVIELPVGATPLDFAYHVHTEVGHRCRGAKVNGQMVTLTHALKSGDQVEVITQKNSQPSRDWLSPHSGYLKSSRARAKARQWFKQQFRDEDLAAGKAALQRELSRREFQDKELLGLVKRFNYKTMDDLYVAVGRGELGAAQVANALHDQHELPAADNVDVISATATPHKRNESGDVHVYGVGDLLTHMARCCKPMHGDEVVGFITRGRGVSVHRSDCSNVKRLGEEHPDRLIDVGWGQDESRGYEVDVEIEAMDRSGLLRDITSMLSAEQVNVLAANTHTNRRTQEAKMRLTLEIQNSQVLDRALSKLRQLRSVYSATRTK